MGVAFCGAGQVLGLESPSTKEPIRLQNEEDGQLEDVSPVCEPCDKEMISWGEGVEDGRKVKG